MASSHLGVCASSFFIESDLPEFVTTSGMAVPNSINNPRPAWCAPRELLHDRKGWTSLSVSHILKDWEVSRYASHCCEIRRHLTRAAHIEVRACLFYDMREAGGQGRCLRADCPTTDFLKGDRLLPSPLFPDIELFDQVSLWPEEGLFWCPLNAMVRHRSPSPHGGPRSRSVTTGFGARLAARSLARSGAFLLD